MDGRPRFGKNVNAICVLQAPGVKHRCRYRMAKTDEIAAARLVASLSECVTITRNGVDIFRRLRPLGQFLCVARSSKRQKTKYS